MLAANSVLIQGLDPQLGKKESPSFFVPMALLPTWDGPTRWRSVRAPSRASRASSASPAPAPRSGQDRGKGPPCAGTPLQLVFCKKATATEKAVLRPEGSEPGLRSEEAGMKTCKHCELGGGEKRPSDPVLRFIFYYVTIKSWRIKKKKQQVTSPCQDKTHSATWSSEDVPALPV